MPPTRTPRKPKPYRFRNRRAPRDYKAICRPCRAANTTVAERMKCTECFQTAFGFMMMFPNENIVLEQLLDGDVKNDEPLPPVVAQPTSTRLEWICPKDVKAIHNGPGAVKRGWEHFDWSILGTDLGGQLHWGDGKDRTKVLPNGETHIEKGDPSLAMAPFLPYDIDRTSLLFESPRCPCRDRLAVHLSSINLAMEERRLNDAFRSTEQVFRGFRDVISCQLESCDLTCIDLICLATVLGSLDALFDCISTADLNVDITVTTIAGIPQANPSTGMNMTFGGYEISMYDPKLIVILVTSLIYQTDKVLQAISDKGQEMLSTPDSPWLLAKKVNIAYLEKVIKLRREKMRKIADSVDGTSCSPKEPLSPS